MIAAAGSGDRLGAGGPKALVQVAGRPLLAWSLDAFRRSASVGVAVIAAPPGHEEAVELVAGETAGVSTDGGEALHLIVVSGGESRAATVGLALAEAGSAAEIFAVHDAARPLVTAELIDALVERLASRPDAAGVIAAAPLTDTVKRAREPRPAKGEFPRGGPTVARTESREHLWAAQTPQVFRAAALRQAHSAGPQRLAAATDDAILVERAGGKVLIEPAPVENLKVTTPADLRHAELLLAGRAG